MLHSVAAFVCRYGCRGYAIAVVNIWAQAHRLGQRVVVVGQHTLAHDDFDIMDTKVAEHLFSYLLPGQP